VKAIFSACLVAVLSSSAAADSPTSRPVRHAGATLGEIFRGPFAPSQLFSMPTAHVVGAYQLRLYGDASLLSERNVLSTSSVASLGFGDLAQLEYRQSTAVSRTNRELFGLPTVGVQFEIPLRERRYLPRFGVALRFGLPRRDDTDLRNVSITFDERATDLYVVSSLRLASVELHLGARITAASIEAIAASTDVLQQPIKRTLLLPALGASFAVGAQSSMIIEASMIPRFELPRDGAQGSIASDPYARTGVRWALLPWMTLDASIGYHLEIKRQRARPESEVDALVDWDIRLGGELAIPWGALVCRSVGIFCS
jgi:hypothetical protein